MKRILILIAALLIAGFAANAHCYPSYLWTTSITYVSDSISTSYSTDMNFRTTGSGTTVFNSGTNFNGWKKLNFETKTQIKVPLNFPSGKAEVGFYGKNKADYINMTDSDIIYCEGDMEIVTLISNNSKVGQWNMIYTDSKVKIAGTYYSPGDTFYSTPSNKETAVIITDCKGTTLPVVIIRFDYYNGRLEWETGVETEIKNYSILYSSDGFQWNNIGTVESKNTSNSTYYLNITKSGFYRLQINEINNSFIYNETKRIQLENDYELSFYPNPVKDVLYINSSKKLKSVQIFNLIGKKLKSVQIFNLIGSKVTEISVRNLPTSIYFIRIVDEDNNTFTNKFLKD